MAGSVRVNLSVPEKVDGVLARVAEATGRSKAAVIMEAVGYRLKHWEQEFGGDYIIPSDFDPRDDRAAVPGPSRKARKVSSLTPQEAWNLEVERKKAAKQESERD